MCIAAHCSRAWLPEVVSPETMHGLILEYGIIAFFENPIPGFSIEDHTSPEESLAFMKDVVLKHAGDVPEKLLNKMLL